MLRRCEAGHLCKPEPLRLRRRGFAALRGCETIGDVCALHLVGRAAHNSLAVFLFISVYLRFEIV